MKKPSLIQRKMPKRERQLVAKAIEIVAASAREMGIEDLEAIREAILHTTEWVGGKERYGMLALSKADTYRLMKGQFGITPRFYGYDHTIVLIRQLVVAVRMLENFQISLDPNFRQKAAALRIIMKIIAG